MSTDRLFPTFRRGELRDECLTYFRNGLRELISPDTGLPFTEDEIAIAVSDLTAWYAEADALDLTLLAVQSRALWMSDQIWPDRAAHDWLVGRHGTLWGLTPLPAAGGSGTATGPCLAGSTFTGSTSIPDDTADFVVDQAGRRYQVLYTTNAASDSVTLSFKGVDVGRETNLAPGAVLRWGHGPLGAVNFVVDARFKGGVAAETDAEFSRRLLARVRTRQGAGNRSMLRDFCRSVDSGVEDCFVYACAYHAGSVHLALVGKRDQTLGPLARVPSVGTVAIVAAAVTPPGTRELPGQVHVVATAVQVEPVDMVLRVDLIAGRGWVDAIPWPKGAVAADRATVTAVASQTSITVSSTGDAPASSAPAIMVWDVDRSRWEQLKVSSVVDGGGGSFTVTLTAAPKVTLAIGQHISPASSRSDQVALAIEGYIDSLGPGEIVADERIGRAYRWPVASDEYPSAVAESELGGWIREALGPALGALGSSLARIRIDGVDTNTPPVPIITSDGPRLLVLGHIAIYPHLS